VLAVKLVVDLPRADADVGHRTNSTPFCTRSEASAAHLLEVAKHAARDSLRRLEDALATKMTPRHS
jgi:hypothetical protein